MRTRAPKNNGSLPMFPPSSDWRPPRLSELPSWKGAKRVALDTEFSDPLLKKLGIGARRGAKICGYSFAIEGHEEGGRGYYVPLRHVGGDNVEDVGQGFNYLRDNLGQHEGELVGANLHVDLDLLTYEGIKPNYRKIICRDVQILAPLIWEMHFSYSLNNILLREGFQPKDESILVEALKTYGGPDAGKELLHVLPARFVGPYGEYDAACLLPLLRALEAKAGHLRQVWDLESRLLPVLLKIRQRGVLIDQPKLDMIDEWSLQEEKKTLDEIRTLTGRTVGVGDCMKAEVMASVLESCGVVVGKTATGMPSVTTASLAAISGHPIGKLIRYTRQVFKLRSTFVKSVRAHMTNCRLHCTYKQIVGSNDKNEKSGAAFGRLSACVAQGTLVEVVRDVSKFPKGIPIEDVRVGDLVYSYDDALQLRLKPVTAITKMGTKSVIRLHWRGTGRHHSGYLDVTPDHLIRTTSGRYVEARLLSKGDYVMALSRGVCPTYGYARLWPTGRTEIWREHRFIWEETGHPVAAHVHHINGNKLDNRVENLQGLSAVDHMAEHYEEMCSPERTARRSASMRARWERDRDRLTALSPRGEAHAGWLGLSKEYLTNLLVEHDWSVTNAWKASGHDFNTFKKYLRIHGFDLAEMKRQKMELILSLEQVEAMLTEHHWSVRNAAAANKHCFRALRKECIRNGFDIEEIKSRAKRIRDARGNQHKINNHEIMGVEILEQPADVYDLTVEDTHNFIAAEICVHNCSPNVQQQPSNGPFASMWRSIYVADPGSQWGCLDYSQVEPRWVIHFAEMMGCRGAFEAAEAYRNDPRTDNHTLTANLTGLDRKYAKAVFLALCYGEGGAKLCRHQLKLPTRWRVTVEHGQPAYFETQEEAITWRKRQKGRARVLEVAGIEGQKILDTFNERLPFVRSLSDLVMKKAEETGMLSILGGRVLHFPLARDGSYDFTYKALNKVAQASSAYQMKLAILAIDREMPECNLQMTVHDEIDGSFSGPDEMHRAAEIMRTVVRSRLPFRVDIEHGKNWGEMSQLCAVMNCPNDAVKDDVGLYYCGKHLC